MQPRFRAARSDDFPEIMDVLRRSFDEVAPDFFVAQTEDDSTFRLRHARVAVVDGAIAGYVRIFARTMLVRGVPVRAGGIGSVATHPDARSRGLATALLEDAIAQMRLEQMRLSFLFTGIPGFYERLGYRVVREPQFTVSRAALIERGSLGTHAARQMDLSTDLPMLVRIYGRASRGTTGRIVRTPRTWLDATAWITGAGDVALDPRTGRVCGYIRHRCRAFGHQILEGECAPGTEEIVLPQLIEKMANRRCECADAIVALAGAATPLATALRAYDAVRETTDVEHPMMTLALDRDPTLAEAIASEPMAFWNSDRI
jgi:predicted N-acetyltransferase YhbS